MTKLDFLINELVTANRILAHQEIVDSFGHVSVRHPERPDRFLLSRARAPDCIEAGDIMEFSLDGAAVGGSNSAPYLERFIHGAVYEARPDVMSVVHSHSESVIPFGVTGVKLKPLMHVCAGMGHEVPTWDSQDKFGDTHLLVSNMEMGRDFAKALGAGSAALMRGHGSVVVGDTLREAVFTAVYLEAGARLQMQALGLGEVKYLSEGEVDKITGGWRGPFTINRAWENWCGQAGREMQAE